MSSKKAMKQAQKQSYAKHRSNISYNKFSFKKKNYQRLKKINSILIVFVFYLYKKEQLKK